MNLIRKLLFKVYWLFKISDKENHIQKFAHATLLSQLAAHKADVRTKKISCVYFRAGDSESITRCIASAINDIDDLGQLIDHVEVGKPWHIADRVWGFEYTLFYYPKK
jgi:hypothetical protein